MAILSRNYATWDHDGYYVTSGTNTGYKYDQNYYASNNTTLHLPTPLPKSQAQLDQEWLEKEVNDICKGAFV